MSQTEYQIRHNGEECTSQSLVSWKSTGFNFCWHSHIILTFPYGWISCGEKDGEWWGEINVLVSEGDEDTPTSTTNLTVEDRVQDGVIALNILKWKNWNIFICLEKLEKVSVHMQAVSIPYYHRTFIFYRYVLVMGNIPWYWGIDYQLLNPTSTTIPYLPS